MPDALKFVKGRDDLIEGLLAPYGGPPFLGGKDFVGEFFSPNTDFVLSWFKDWERPLLYSHGLDGDVKTEVVGRIAVKARDKGLWMQAQLDKANEYKAEIAALVEKGALGASSGSVAHLVATDQKSGEILRWPLIEGSLTPMPANPDAQVGYAMKSADAIAHLAVVATAVPEALKEEPVAEEPEVPEELEATKEGRRHNSSDRARIQQIYQLLGELGIEADTPDATPEGSGKSLGVPPAPMLAIKAGDGVERPSANDLEALKSLIGPAIKDVVASEIKRYLDT